MSKSNQERKPATAPQRELPAWLVFCVMAAAVWAVYARSLDAPWIFDDSLSVLQNRSITSLWPLVGDAEHPGPLQPPIENPMSARPLVNAIAGAQFPIGVSSSPRGYRVVNVLLHLACAMLVWAITWRTLRLPYFGGQFDRSAKWLALGVALLWALHPLVTEAVVYVTQRTELMVALFYLATLYSSLRYWTAESPGSRKVWLVAATLACLAGAASKEVMVSAPLVVLLFDWTFFGGSLARTLAPLVAALRRSGGELAGDRGTANRHTAQRVGRLRPRHPADRLVVYPGANLRHVSEARPLARSAGDPLRAAATRNFRHHVAVCPGRRGARGRHARPPLAAASGGLAAGECVVNPRADAPRPHRHRNRRRAADVFAARGARRAGGGRQAIGCSRAWPDARTPVGRLSAVGASAIARRRALCRDVHAPGRNLSRSNRLVAGECRRSSRTTTSPR